MSKRRFIPVAIFLLLLLGGMAVWGLAQKEAAPLSPDQITSELMERDPAAPWKLPVSFYGKVVDQYGQPVPQVSVKFGLNDTSPRGTSYYSAQSDANGIFSLTGVKGMVLSVSISKDGYYQSRFENNTFGYYDIASGAHYQPDPKKPEVFHLYKGGEKVALIRQDFWEVPVSVGKEVTIDLLNQTLNSPNGQLKAELLENVRTANGVRGTWSMRLTAVDGGIQTTMEEFPFVAPESGYQPSIVIGRGIADTSRDSMYIGKAFLKTPQGYARLVYNMVDGNSYFRLSYYFNPSGSRSLEPEPLQQYPNLEIYNERAPKHAAPEAQASPLK